MKVVRVRNVNYALEDLRRSVEKVNPQHRWVKRSSRNGDVLEVDSPVATVYEMPWERIAFSAVRDCNVFFQFFEALWILAGRDDVAMLKIFNPRMALYSDDGVRFHAAYGHRLRSHFGIDQLKVAADMLSNSRDTRRVALSIWDPSTDLGTETVDLPCNDMIFFKIRNDGFNDRLDMTVCCRSNDALWGAYGTNVVQFSMLHQILCEEAKLCAGEYTQMSDSLHVYCDNEVWKRMQQSYDFHACLYTTDEAKIVPILRGMPLWAFLSDCDEFCRYIVDRKSYHLDRIQSLFLLEVAMPLLHVWTLYKEGNLPLAIEEMDKLDTMIDWNRAAMMWLLRRVK